MGDEVSEGKLGGYPIEYPRSVKQRSQRAYFLFSLGDYSVTGSDPNWEGGTPGLGLCAKIPGENGGYFTADACQQARHYVCMSKPLTEVPDNKCPDQFFPYKEHCYYANANKINYTTAVDECSKLGSILWAPREQANFEFFKNYGNKICE